LKKSFAMLFAIAFIIVLGTIGTIMMYMSAVNIKTTENDYLDVQLKTEAHSAIEYAIMALEARDFNNDGCINKIDINNSFYEVNMTFHYFLTECPSDCNCTNITSKESNGSVMINLYVKSKIDPNIRFFRQTIQKP